jgi:hypothetical protein
MRSLWRALPGAVGLCLRALAASGWGSSAHPRLQDGLLLLLLLTITLSAVPIAYLLPGVIT